MFNSTDEGFPWNDFRNFFIERSQLANVPNGVETVPKISIAFSRAYERFRQTDDKQRTLFANKNAIDT